MAYTKNTWLGSTFYPGYALSRLENGLEAAAAIADAAAAPTAATISFQPTGTIAANTVQAAIAEVAVEAGGSGSTGDAFVTVAAADTPTAQKQLADYVCTGTGGSRTDHTTINSAVTAIAATGGEITLLPGTYYCGGKIVLATTGTGASAKQLTFRCSGGATIDGNWVTATTDIIMSLESWNVDVFNPSIVGNTSKGFGIGIAYGSATQTVHNCNVFSPRITNCDTAIEFGIVSTSSSGDNNLFGGYMSNCKTGLKSRGFVNYAYGLFIANCNDGIVCTSDRGSQKVVVVGATILSCTNTYVDVQRGAGSTFYDLWAEDTAAAADASVAVIRIGSAANTVLACHFLGTTHLHPGALDGITVSPYLVSFTNAHDSYFESIQISSNGVMPGVAIAQEASTSSGTNRIRRVYISPAASPSTWNPSTMVLTKSGTGKVIIEEVPAPYRSTVGGLAIGGGTPRPVEQTYTIDFATFGNRSWFWAKDTDGHLAMIKPDSPQSTLTGSVVLPASTVPVVSALDFPGTGTTYVKDQAVTYTGLTTTSFTGCSGGTGTFSTGEIVSQNNPASGLKDVMEGLAADGVWYQLLAKKYKLNVFPQGGSADADHVNFGSTLDNIKVTGAGPKRTQVANYGMNLTEDTEPINIGSTVRNVHFSDFEVIAYGAADDNDSSDGIDWDHVVGGRLERVMVRRSRARGIVFDGKDTNPSRQSSSGNVIYACIIRGRPTAPELNVASGGSLAADTYTYAVAWVDEDPQGSGGTTAGVGETLCSDPMTITATLNQKCTVKNIEVGPAYDSLHGVTKRKIYRRSVAQGWRLLTTLSDNTTTSYIDNATDASIAGNAAPTTTPASTIIGEGIQFLSGRNHLVTACTVDGVGGTGIHTVTFSNDPHGYGHQIIGNNVRHSLGHGITIGDGENILVQGNVISNSGSGAAPKSGMHLVASSATGASVDRTLISGNQIFDDQGASSIAAISTTLSAIDLTNANGGVSNTLISGNVGKGIRTNGVLDSAVNTVLGTNLFDKPDSSTGTGFKDTTISVLDFTIADATTTGVKGDIIVPYGCTIVEADLLADQSGSIVVDIFKCTYALFDAGATHPVSGDKITSSTPPTITTATKSTNTTLTGWTTAIAAGDVLRFNVNSVTSIQRVTVSLKVRRV